MGRRLYYIDSYGRARRDRRAENRRPSGAGAAGKALIILAALALILVIASAVH